MTSSYLDHEDGDALSDAAIERFARQLVLPGWDEATQKQLFAAHIAIIGLGGLGMPVLAYLAGAGIGQITLYEPDTADLTNLHRQHMSTEADIGKPKIEIARHFIARRFPDCQLTTHQAALDLSSASALFPTCDAVLDCTDNMASRQMIAQAARQAGTPHIFAGAVRHEGQISVFASGHKDHPDSPCFGCLFPEEASYAQAPSCAQAGISGPFVGLMAMLQAQEALKLLTGSGKPLIGTLLMVDGLDTRFSPITVKRQASCPICSDS